MKQALRANLLQLKDLFSQAIPKGKYEIILFTGFFMFYGIITYLLVSQTCIVNPPVAKWDMYFCFDNGVIFNSGIENVEGHPYLIVFTYIPMYIGALLTKLSGLGAKTIFFCIGFISMVCLANMYVFRYINKILKLSLPVSFIIAITFGCFATNLILCFTVETFTISLFLLTFMVYYYSRCIIEDKSVTFATNAFFALVLGGVTITNFAKGVVPILFIKGGFWKNIKKIAIISLAFIAILVFLDVQFGFFEKVFDKASYFADAVPLAHNQHSLIEKITDTFWGAPILMPELMMVPTGFKSNYQMINIAYYHHLWQYVVIGLLFALVVWSIIKNYKNKLVQMLALIWLVDIFIHVILKFGAWEHFFIYGGHWVYIVPLLLAWLYKSSQGWEKKVYTLILGLIAITMITNNILRLSEFIALAKIQFPVNFFG